MLNIPDEMQADIAKAANLLRAHGAREVFLFGSIVDPTRDHRPRDIDFAVTGLPPSVFFHTYGELMGVLDHSFDLIDLDVETPFVRHVREQGHLERVG